MIHEDIFSDTYNFNIKLDMRHFIDCIRREIILHDHPR